MLKLLERTIHSLDGRLVLLAPQNSVPAFFRNVVTDKYRHGKLVREMQALRGSIYLHDGALGREHLSPEGLHETAEDARSWHLLTLDKHHRVSGCAWYLQHDSSVSADHLRVRHTPLARMNGWSEKLQRAVESEISQARRARINYVEVGGWAVSKESRCTSEGLVLALAGYSLGRICGDCLGITTATVRHCSSSILRRLGGAPLSAADAAIPRYYDPRYKCEMEILRFDSRHPNAKYGHLIEMLRQKMTAISVIAMPAAAVSMASQINLPNAASWAEGWSQAAFAR